MIQNNELLKKAGESKYTLVIMAAKRAREIVDENKMNCEKQHKPVICALKEILEEKITFERRRTGLK